VSTSEKNLHEQLVDARENIRRVIDALQYGSVISDVVYGDPEKKGNLIADLTAMLKKIDDRLAVLGSGKNYAKQDRT
jgi:hypothetical protein